MECYGKFMPILDGVVESCTSTEIIRDLANYQQVILGSGKLAAGAAFEAEAEGLNNTQPVIVCTRQESDNLL